MWLSPSSYESYEQKPDALNLPRAHGRLAETNRIDANYRTLLRLGDCYAARTSGELPTGVENINR